MKKNLLAASDYTLTNDGYFVINNYNDQKPFSNFFPGIAGVWGIPMWVFYVNRGQGIASFGTESKDKAILEFQPAHKSYRLTPSQGFRTFIKVKSHGQTHYWEPFQSLLLGTDFKKDQTMKISAHDLTIEEVNHSLGIKITVNYSTLPEEPFSALVRKVKLENISKHNIAIEMLDGLPVIVPFGLGDWLNKHISRTIEAWVKVRNIENKIPFYQLNVEVADKPEVKHIVEGNFFFSFNPGEKAVQLNPVIVEASQIFGERMDFASPARFFEKTFELPKKQLTDSKSPCAFTFIEANLKAGADKTIVSLFGYARDIDQLKNIKAKVLKTGFIDAKAKRNQEIIDEIKNFALTVSSSNEFNLYAQHTFLDNVLRGGLPISLKTSEGNVAFNVYSRKHGDLERDYNFFTLAPTFFSQGNGNYRDVNQNRRNDVWFNSDVKESHLINFLNLVQADGYNPLIVKGTSFTVKDQGKLNQLIDQAVEAEKRDDLKSFLKTTFLPGALADYIVKNNIKLSMELKEFIGHILEDCRKQELAEHGEGFWTDHWTYNLDMIESYLSLYPEELENILLKKRAFTFYHNHHYVFPRDQRYILTDRGVRQYKSVFHPENGQKDVEPKLKTDNGKGEVYLTILIVKLLCLIANKAATFDPSGAGIEMEADKPNWYDALNGLPGLMGSSISETFELKRFAQFVLRAFEKLHVNDQLGIVLFEELAQFIQQLKGVLSSQNDPLNYWNQSNELKEKYRQKVREGISGKEQALTVGDIKNFLKLIVSRTEKSESVARNQRGELSTYFYHEVTAHDSLPDSKHVRPTKFKIHHLPLFLEGYVHALRAEEDKTQAQGFYRQVIKSGLYDSKLKMFKVNDNLTSETEEIGRTRVFPSGWLENQSIWLHMEYKFMLELIRTGLYKEYYENFKNVMIPFLKPEVYGRSILENSSFIASSVHEDKNFHGQGFVARLSGSTAEFIHMWLYMNIGKEPFALDNNQKLVLNFNPVLKGDMFTQAEHEINFYSQHAWKKIRIPKNTYAFNFLGNTLIVYHNPKRQDTFGQLKPSIEKIQLHYTNSKKSVIIDSSYLPEPYSKDIRQQKVEQIDVYFGKK